MNWQKLVSLIIVASTAAIFAWNRFKPRKFAWERDSHCGCASSSHSAAQNSIVLRSRRGERPRVTVKAG